MGIHYTLTQLQKRGVFLAVMLIALLVFATPVFAKEYHIAAVDMQVTTSADGSMHIIEKRTFRFEDTFSFVYWTFPYSESQPLTINSVGGMREGDAEIFWTAQEGVDYTLEREGSDQRLQVNIDASNEDYTIVLDYTIANAVDRYLDVGELYWMFIGRGWGVRTDQVNITITPPAPTSKDAVRAWAHGPLNGNVAILDDGTVTLEVTNLPANTFVEGRVAYPADLFPELEQQPYNQLEVIVAQETEWANEANAQRSRARFALMAAGVGATVVSVGLFVALVLIFNKHGREHKIFIENDGKYWRDDPMPDMNPALVGTLYRFGTSTPDDIVATIMDLTDKKYLAMQEVDVEKKKLFRGTSVEKRYIFTVDTTRLAELSTLERDVVDLMTTAGASTELEPNQFSFDFLEKYAKKHAEKFSKAVRDIQSTASGEVEARGYIESNSVMWQVISFIMCAFIVAPPIFAAIFTGAWWLGLPALLGIPAVVYAFNMRRRSPGGQELYRRYDGIKNYLTDFSKLDEAPPTSVVIWNRYLVLATVFGIAEQVSKDLEMVAPQVVQDPNFATSYLWFYAMGPSGTFPAQSFSSALSTAQTAASAASSGAGMGGGFSGGGGFGGGGGGGGAG